MGAAVGDPNINATNLASDRWWEPMSDDEVDAFVEGRW